MMQKYWALEHPWAHHVDKNSVPSVIAEAPQNAAAFVLNGLSMRSDEALFVEFARAMSFPDHFGKNWAALLDCLEDMTWNPPASSFLLVVSDWAAVLSESRDDKSLLETTLQEVGSRWAMEAPGRAPFNSLLVTETPSA
ncbi:barstar family protein [Streptomyces sp. SP18CS02]|uniref:barstar family protein n=1 Tax=Streptomyces sp. SP18CS02 TaxID=3002531 RepID=UPI002E777D4D|nr:barstar family protein [Streptomyces sp. SP18CS02]MEE1750994.1 barstar family protein [Streptomyces sp. SP18CS02]